MHVEDVFSSSLRSITEVMAKSPAEGTPVAPREGGGASDVGGASRAQGGSSCGLSARPVVTSHCLLSKRNHVNDESCNAG